MSWNIDDGDPVIIPDPYQEAKPRLTQKEIEKAALVHASFKDPKNQMLLTHIMRSRFHRETFFAFHKISYMNNRNPVDHPYSVDQYVTDKELSAKDS